MMQADSSWTSWGVRMTAAALLNIHLPSGQSRHPLCGSFALQGATTPQNLQYFPSLLVSTAYQRLSFPPPGFAYSSLASLLWFGSRSPPSPTCIHQKKKRLSIPAWFYLPFTKNWLQWISTCRRCVCLLQRFLLIQM